MQVSCDHVAMLELILRRVVCHVEQMLCFCNTAEYWRLRKNRRRSFEMAIALRGFVMLFWVCERCSGQRDPPARPANFAAELYLWLRCRFHFPARVLGFICQYRKISYIPFIDTENRFLFYCLQRTCIKSVQSGI